MPILQLKQNQKLLRRIHNGLIITTLLIGVHERFGFHVIVVKYPVDGVQCGFIKTAIAAKNPVDLGVEEDEILTGVHQCVTVVVCVQDPVVARRLVCLKKIEYIKLQWCIRFVMFVRKEWRVY